jgi:hypothetical protein
MPAAASSAGDLPSPRGFALLRPPFESKPQQINQLHRPGYYIGGNPELVIEKGCLVHFYFLLVLEQICA